MTFVSQNITGIENIFTKINKFLTENAKGITLSNPDATADFGMVVQSDNEFCLVGYTNKDFAGAQILMKAQRNAGLYVGNPAGGNPAYGHINANGYEIEGVDIEPKMARAWARISNPSGSPSPINSVGVSSITDNGTGQFTLNLSSAMANANYVVAGAAEYQGNLGNIVAVTEGDHGSRTTSSVPLCTVTPNGKGDVQDWSVVIFGD